MKKVLIIGADFSPSSLPPATRIRFFASHLPQFGWEPIVLTTDSSHYDWNTDPENARLLPESLKVIRTSAWSKKFTSKIGIGDIGARSMWAHWRALSDLCRKKAVDLILIPVPPFLPMMLGRLAHLRFGVPYVIDYIDPWVTDYYWSLPKDQRPRKWALAYASAKMLEPLSLKKVSHIVGVSKGTTDSVVNRYPWLTADDATDIPYGGEPGDLEYLRQHPRQNKIFDARDGRFHICYVGAYPKGMEPTMRALFAAVKMGLARSPELFAKLRLHFVGTVYGAGLEDLYQLKPIAEEMGLGAYVNEHPARVSYLDALQLQLDSHALAILGSDAAHYTASKVFPYILARKPLLTIFHEESSVVEILEETEAGDVITFNSDSPPGTKVAEISNRLETLLQSPEGYSPPTRWDAFERYTTRSMAGRLAAAFDKAIHHSESRLRVGVRTNALGEGTTEP
jgi:glycosyl transferase family 4